MTYHMAAGTTARKGRRLGVVVLALAGFVSPGCGGEEERSGPGSQAPAARPAAPARAEKKAEQGIVMVSRGPGQRWSPMKTRTLADLPAIPVDKATTRFGGVTPEKGALAATGFFRVEKLDGRWWLVDPDGNLFLHRGVASVRANRTDEARRTQVERYGSPEGWAASTLRLLRGHGFNGTGAWSDDAAFQAAGGGMVYTRLWSFMSSYGKARGGTYQKPGHTGYPGDCPFLFDPGFAEFCDEHARQLMETKDDPWLLGHFTDNELPWSRKMLERYLALPEGDPGREAARRWLRERHGPQAAAEDISEADRADFLAFAVDRYFSIVSAAIRKHDPNHLVLGARYHGGALKLPEVFRAAGRHVDVVSVNYYHAWQPDSERLRSWSADSGRPVIITEWYAKGVDSGMENKGGAGWLVKTQAERGMFYQNFTLGLLESPYCVGWHWFKYQDNDPADRMADPSNRDSNKGIVTNRFAEYEALLDAMRDINTRSHGLIRHFDAERRKAAAR